jgi:hypothetical protein
MKPCYNFKSDHVFYKPGISNYTCKICLNRNRINMSNPSFIFGEETGFKVNCKNYKETK